MIAIAVGVAGAAGAVTRFAVEHWLHGSADDAFPGGFPRGTFTVNLTGSLALGLLVGTAASSTVTTIVGIGFLGGYTTFSTYTVEVVTMTLRRQHRGAVLYAVGSIVLSTLAAALGFVAGSLSAAGG